MELKTYTRENSKYQPVGIPTFRIGKNGVLKLSKGAFEKIGLTNGDKILFHQDKQKPKDWYIEKTDDDNGFVLRQARNHLEFNAKGLAIEILKSIDLDLSSSITFRMATEPMEEKYYAIITKSAPKPESK